MHLAELTMKMDQQGMYMGKPIWVGLCVELGLVASGPDSWQVWQDLFAVCQAQIAYAIEHGLEKELIRG